MDSYAKFCEAREMDGWIGGIWVGDEKPIEKEETQKYREEDKVVLLDLGVFLISMIVRI